MKSFTKQSLTHQCKEQTDRPITHSPSVPLTVNCPIPHSLPFFSLSRTTNERIGNQCCLTHQLHPFIKDLCKRRELSNQIAAWESIMFISVFTLRVCLVCVKERFIYDNRALWLSFKVLYWLTHTFHLIKSCYGETQTLFAQFIMQFCTEFQSLWKYNSILSQFHTNKH